MSDIFTVVLDLSRVESGEEKDQLYLAMADTTKMKMIYEFKRYIQFLFSLDYCVELFCEGVRLPDLEDIRVLSRLEVIEVVPENAGERNYEGMELVSKSKGCYKKPWDGDPKPVPGGSVTKCNYIDYQESVSNLKSLEAGKIVQAQEGSGFGAYKRAQMSCGPSFPASDRECNAVQKPQDNLMRKAYNMQENETLKLGETTGMAQNLKLGTFLQNRYYGWCEKSDGNPVTGKSHFQKSNETPNFKSGEKPCFFKSNTKYPNVRGVDNKPYISNDLKLGDVNLSKGTFRGSNWAPVNMKKAKNHGLCDREPPAHEIRSKSCSGRPDPHSGPCGSDVIPGTVQKPFTNPTTNTSEEKSFAEGNIPRKPLSVEDALKILTEAAAERSKTLSGNKPASQNDGKKNQFGGACKSFKASPAGEGRNFQKGNVKHQTTSKNLGTLDNDSLAQVILDSHGPEEWQFQFPMPKQEVKYKFNKKVGRGHQNQGNALLKGCMKLDQNQGRKTGSNGKGQGKTGAPNPPHQFNPAQKKKTCEVSNSTKTGDKSQVEATVKGSEKFDNCHGQKTGNTGEVELKPGELEALPQCNATKNKTPMASNATETGDMSEVNALFESCVKIDKNQGRKTEGDESTGKVEAETGAPNPVPQCDPTQKTKKPKKRKKPKCNNVTVSQALVTDCKHFDNNHLNDKTGGAGKTEAETAPSNPLLKYGNAENRIGQSDCFGEFSTSWTASLEECLYYPPLDEMKRGKAFNEGESAGCEKSPSRELHSSRGDPEPGVPFPCGPVGPSGNDARSNSPGDLETTAPALGKEGGNGANVSNPSANSSRNLNFSGGAVKRDVAASPFPDLKQGKSIVGDDMSPKDNDKDKSESQSGSPVTNRAIAFLNKIADKENVKDTKGINVSDNGREAKLVPSPGQADLMLSQSRDGVRTGALPGVGTGSTRIGGGDTDSSGSRCVQENEVLALSCRSVQRVEQKAQDLHGPEGSGRDTEVERLPSSSGTRANLSKGNDSRSDKNKGGSPAVSKECVIALVMIITALAF